MHGCAGQSSFSLPRLTAGFRSGARAWMRGSAFYFGCVCIELRLLGARAEAFLFAKIFHPIASAASPLSGEGESCALRRTTSPAGTNGSSLNPIYQLGVL